LNIRTLQSAVFNPQAAVVRAAAAFALLFVAVCQLSSQAVGSQQSAVGNQLTLLAKDGRRALAITVVNGQEFVQLDDLAAVFQLAVREESLGALTVSYKGKTIVLTPDQALASVAGRLVSLPAPPMRSGRRWMVPVEFIGRALVLIYDARLDLHQTSHLLVIGDLRVPRVTVRYDAVSTGGRLTIDATPRVTSAVRGEGNERLTIKFDADALDVSTPLPSAPGSQNLVQGIQVADATTLTVELGPRVVGFRATTQQVETAERLTIDLRVAQSETPPPPPAPPAVPAPVTPASPPTPPSAISSARTLATIVIDPGHGGEDRGAEGSTGVKEKDVALAVALQLKAAIEGRLGTRVLLTRDDDRQLSIDDRTSFANNNKADLFISLHANASLRTTTTGASIYCAAFDRGVEAAGPTTRAERAPVVGGGVRDIELVAWNRAQTRHLNRSLAFAAALEQVLHDRVPLTARAVNRAPLKVLESANMPAVLIEMGFLSNPDQEKQLAASEFQAAFVQAATDAIVRFRDGPPAGGAR
jgi:N-acetylmuramoyl-L-alanine amidase